MEHISTIEHGREHVAVISKKGTCTKYYLADDLEKLIGKKLVAGLPHEKATYIQLCALKSHGIIPMHTSNLKLVDTCQADAHLKASIMPIDVNQANDEMLGGISDTSNTCQSGKLSCTTEGSEPQQECQDSAAGPGRSPSISVMTSFENNKSATSDYLQRSSLNTATPMNSVQEEVTLPCTQATSMQETSIQSQSEMIAHLPGGRKRYALDITDGQHAKTRNILEHFNRAMSNRNDLKNAGLSCGETTAGKHMERVKCYLAIVYRCNIDLKDDVTRALSIDLINGYIEYLIERRQLNQSSVRNHLCSLIQFIKFRMAHGNDDDGIKANGSFIMEKLRYKCNEYNREMDKERRISRATGTKSRINWQTLLDILRQTLDKFNQSEDGVAKSKMSQFMCIFLIQTMVAPCRIKELTTLKIMSHDELEGSTSAVNALVRVQQGPKGQLEIVLSDYKTASTYGRKHVELWRDENLQIVQHHLLNHLKKHRSRLLHGNTHSYLFVNHFGVPFATESSMSAYVSTEYTSIVGRPVTSHCLRHAFWTWFFSTEGINKNDTLVESIARVLSHGTRSARKYYNDQTDDELEIEGRHFIASTSAKILNGDDPCAAVPIDIDGDVDDMDDAHAYPSVGDICAFVEGESTTRNPKFLLAKVLRWNKAQSMVLLSQLREDQTHKGRYEMAISKSWWETSQAIVWPIDVSYEPNLAAFVLRTPAIEIHNLVFA